MVPFHDLRPSTAQVREAVEHAWLALLDGDQFVGGASVERFEATWAAFCDTAEAVGVASGTDALQLTLRALGLRAGDEVVVPANAHVGTAEAVVLAGAAPRFADVEPGSLLLDRQSLADVLTSRTAAVIVVHLYGQMPDMDSICETAAGAGVAVIEDATQAPGASWRGRRAGSVSRAGCFGFHPEATLGALGDAGAVVTSDPALADALRVMRNHGRAVDTAATVQLGTASRLDSLQADVLTAKVGHLQEWVRARGDIVRRYRQATTSGRIRFVDEIGGSASAHHLAVARVPRRHHVRMMLDSLGVQTRVHYPVPLPLLPPFRAYAQCPLPAVERAADEVLSLPLSPHMSEEQVAHVCRSLQSVEEMLALEDNLGPTP